MLVLENLSKILKNIYDTQHQILIEIWDLHVFLILSNIMNPPLKCDARYLISLKFYWIMDKGSNLPLRKSLGYFCGEEKGRLLSINWKEE